MSDREEEKGFPFETPADQLHELNEAIYKILAGGQSYKIGSRSLTRADLSALIAERDRLEAQIQGSQSTLIYGAYVADFGPDNRR